MDNYWDHVLSPKPLPTTAAPAPSTRRLTCFAQSRLGAVWGRYSGTIQAVVGSRGVPGARGMNILPILAVAMAPPPGWHKVYDRGRRSRLCSQMCCCMAPAACRLTGAVGIGIRAHLQSGRCDGGGLFAFLFFSPRSAAAPVGGSPRAIDISRGVDNRCWSTVSCGWGLTRSSRFCCSLKLVWAEGNCVGPSGMQLQEPCIKVWFELTTLLGWPQADSRWR
mmetsp:Transcript_52790/g.86702  ORF Transcript_52790/g.86702 Transcript_52790/m.86702 type:complete len:221 (+) Transcript_52790:1766-2428(+)